MSPARHGRPAVSRRRLGVLAMVAVVLVGGAVVGSRVAAHPPPPTTLQAATVVAEAAPQGAQSSSWYCTGGTGPTNDAAQSSLLVVNDGTTAAGGTITVVGGTGTTRSAALDIPARAQVTEDPGQLVPGEWIASRVVVGAGAVTVSNLVDGPAGWAVAPCATETSPNWYFATGSTQTADQLYVSLFNPTATMSVVDLSFLTSHGTTAPQLFQGLVVPPGQVVTAEVADYVQDAASIATTVTARAGQVVASELEIYDDAGVSGVSLRLGAPALSRRWVVPRTDDAEGGASQLVVYNPSSLAQQVRVAVRLPSGPVAPFDQTVAAGASWAIDASQQTRIPIATDYAVQVSASGGPGVVVERSQASASASAAPQWGAVTGIATAAPAADCWVVPSTAGTDVGGAPLTLAVLDLSARAVTVHLSALSHSGLQPVPGVRSVRLPAHGFRVLPVGTASPAQVDADGPVVVMGEWSAGSSVVAVPAAPAP